MRLAQPALGIECGRAAAGCGGDCLSVAAVDQVAGSEYAPAGTAGLMSFDHKGVQPGPSRVDRRRVPGWPRPDDDDVTNPARCRLSVSVDRCVTAYRRKVHVV